MPATIAGSTTRVTIPIVGCLAVAEEILGKNRQWNAVNGAQERFLNGPFALGRDKVLGMSEVTSKAAWTAEEINDFLRKAGFSIELSKLGPDEFGMASIFKLALKWLVAGSQTYVSYSPESSGLDSKHYRAADIPASGVVYYSIPNHEHPVAQILTENGDEVYLTMVNEPIAEENLEAASLMISAPDMTKLEGQFDNLVFPMIDLDQEIKLDWIIDMWTRTDSGQRAKIVEALQQTKLRMNHLGAKVDSAAAMKGVFESVSSGPPPCCINQPFLVVIRRPGLSQDLFVGYMDTDSWKEPKMD